MSYDKIILFYFTGTGNALMVGQWVGEIAGKNKLEFELHNIRKTGLGSGVLSGSKQLIVFISPVHGFNFPPVMLHFLRHFPAGNCDVLLMNTRAGMRIGSWVTPGLSGISFGFAALMLARKGYRIRGMIPVDMPSNWLSIHPGLSKNAVTFIHQRMKEKSCPRISKVMEGKRCFVALRELLQDLLIAPVSLGYYLVGRFIFAKTFFASRDCDNCGICISACPVKAIKLIDGRPFWTFKCESCMRCMSHCPKRAIETAHGSVILLSLIFSLLFLTVFYKLLGFWTGEIENGWVRFILESALFIPIIAVWYRIVHYLMRFRRVERLVVFSSLTKYRFWGRRYNAFDKIYKFKH
ncbi:MAG TPA: EFR1 family ferrodoxin [Bacteroidales bacterium]|nr:EFR1 family ferrodoxin [Bacteroidales bacterium]